MLGLIEDPVWNQMMEVVQGLLAAESQRQASDTAISAELTDSNVTSFKEEVAKTRGAPYIWADTARETMLSLGFNTSGLHPLVYWYACALIRRLSFCVFRFIAKGVLVEDAPLGAGEWGRGHVPQSGGQAWWPGVPMGMRSEAVATLVR